MAITKQQKILAGVLALGLGALLFDRVVLSGGASGPQATSAAAVATAGPTDAGAAQRSAAAEARALAATAARRSTGAGMAQRLADYFHRRGLDDQTVRDGFRPSSAWIAPPAAGRPAAGGPTGTQTSPRQQFAQSHRLVAVMGSGAAGVAVIDSQTLRVGQTIDGFRLISVRERSAILQPTTAAGGEPVELHLATGP